MSTAHLQFQQDTEYAQDLKQREYTVAENKRESAQCGMLEIKHEEKSLTHSIEKKQVALRFAKAMGSYPEQAIVQKQISQELIAFMHQYVEKKQFEHLFELGCGSGNLTQLLDAQFQINRLSLNDLYPQVQQQIQLHRSLEWRIGDIEMLNFPQQLDCIASSSVLQWMTDLDYVLEKCHHALNRNGYLCFSSFAPQNLIEIKTLTGHGLSYLSLDEVRSKLLQCGFEVVYASERIHQLYFMHPQQVLKHLKETGVTATASNFKWNKQRLQEFYQGYEQFVTSDELHQKVYTLTYHPLYFIARRIS